MEHLVRTYNLSGKIMYEKRFGRAEEAYEFYIETIETLKNTLPEGYGVTVVRYNDGVEMAEETVIGTH